MWRTSIASVFLGSHHLNFSKRRMRPRISGGLAGVRGQPRSVCRSALPRIKLKATTSLTQGDGGEEGPLIDRQGIQAEEPADGLGEGQSQSGSGRRGRGEYRGVWRAARRAA